MALMLTTTELPLSTSEVRLVRARAKVLAREDRAMKTELIKLRREAGLTQKQVAEIIGVSQQAINKLERYDSDPKLSTLRRYANAVGALVAHNVVPDVGQSIWLAAAPRWDASFTLPNQSIQATRPHVSLKDSGSWSDSKRTDFALGA